MNVREIAEFPWVKIHRRTHTPHISFGCWKLCLNGIQFFAGPFALTFHWPYFRKLGIKVGETNGQG